MSRLNAKTAKRLRKAAGYRNASATPAKPTFPGIHHLLRFPTMKRRTTVKRSSACVDGRWAVVETPVEVACGRRWGYRKFTPDADQPMVEEREPTPGGVDIVHTIQAYTPVPVTKPGKYDERTAKGQYIVMKRCMKQGFDAIQPPPYKGRTVSTSPAFSASYGENMMKMRPHQKQAMDDIYNQWQRQHRHREGTVGFMGGREVHETVERMMNEGFASRARRHDEVRAADIVAAQEYLLKHTKQHLTGGISGACPDYEAITSTMPEVPS